MSLWRQCAEGAATVLRARADLPGLVPQLYSNATTRQACLTAAGRNTRRRFSLATHYLCLGRRAKCRLGIEAACPLGLGCFESPDVYLLELETFMRATTNFRAISVTASVLMLATLGACVAPMQTRDAAYPAQYPAPAGAYPQGGYPAAGQPAPNQQRAYSEFGRVSNVEVLRTPEQGSSSGLGAVIGAVAGAVVGRQIGGGSGRDAATVVGVVGGAVAGNEIEKNRSTTVRESYRVSIQLDNGTSRAYDVPSFGELRVGDRVRIENGQIFRM